MAEGYTDRLMESIRAVHTACDAYDAAMQTVGGCGDGYCRVTGKASGQHTNAGCRCYADKMKAQLVMLAARQLRDALENV